MKKETVLTAFLTGITTLSLMVVPVQAQTVTSTVAATKLLQTDRVANLKARADLEIDRRVTSLTKLMTRIGTFKKLTDTQKASFTRQIQTEITNLQTLKTKIDADTDLTTLRTDVQSIIKSYRVYALFIPQIEIIGAAERMGTTMDKLQTLITKLQARIQKAQTQGKDVTAMQTALSDMQTKLTDATTQYQNAVTTVTPLIPDGYPGNKTTLVSARTMLQNARMDLETAGKDARSIIRLLEAAEGITPTAVPLTTLQPTQ